MEMLGWIILSIGISLGLSALLASKASDIAQDKGYEKRTWFHMCFWLGLLSYIIIAAMPDRTLYAKQQETNNLLQTLIDEQKKKLADMNQSQHDDISHFLPRL